MDTVARARGRRAACRGWLQVVAPVEPELHLGWLAVGVLGDLDGVLGPGQRGLDVAHEGVDRLEFVVRDDGLAIADDLTVVDRASAGGDLEAVQAVGHQGRWQRRLPGQELLDGLVRERPWRQAGQVRQAVLGGLYRRHEGHLVLRAAAGLAGAALATEVGVVDLDRAASRMPSRILCLTIKAVR